MWLLKEDVLERMREAKRAGLQVTEERQRLFEEERQAVSLEDGPPCLTVIGEVAQICVEGVLTKKPDFFAMLFYGANTAYVDIRESLALAAGRPEVSRVELVVDSPGGHWDGLSDTFTALQGFDKPIAVKAENAFSAAYGISAVAGPIRATSIGSMFGSVGVAASYFVTTENAPFELINITNSDSPDKRPDVRTEEGRAVVVRELDAIHQVFATAIAEGRDRHAEGAFTLDRINKEFGRGASFIASEAQRRGMIDSIAEPSLRVVPNPQPNAAAKGAKEKTRMDLRTLKAENPDVYQAAVETGIKQERDRVCAHLKMGTASGALKTAHKAIEEGEGMTQTLQAEYLSAGMNRRDLENRQADDDATEAALKEKKLENEDAFGSSVLAAFDAAMGEVEDAR